MRKKRVIFFVLSLFLLTACASRTSDPQDAVSRTVFAMDTVMELTAYGKNAEAAMLAAEREITRLDHLFRRGDPKSEIDAINTQKDVQVSSDTSDVISAALSVSEKTDGAFDISVTPLIDLWGFYTKEFYVPTPEELLNAKEAVDYRKVRVSGDRISVGADTELELGGIAKGYLSDRIMKIWQEHGVTSGIVSLGGNVQALGTKPDGSPFRVALQNPDDPASYNGFLSVGNRAVITSGAYQRNFTKDGVTYHHILDPGTGKPAESGLKSVTVVSESGTYADALSTALFVMGADSGAHYWRTHGDFEVIFITDNDRILISPGLQSVFESQFPVEIITE